MEKIDIYNETIEKIKAHIKTLDVMVDETGEQTDVANHLISTIEAEFGYDWESYQKDFDYLIKATNVEIWEYYLSDIMPRLKKELTQ